MGRYINGIFIYVTRSFVLCLPLPLREGGVGALRSIQQIRSLSVRRSGKPAWVVKLNNLFRSSERIEQAFGFTRQALSQWERETGFAGTNRGPEAPDVIARDRR